MRGNREKSKIHERVIAFVIFSITGIVLGLAMYLTPNPNGFGTHQQLGLEQCGFITLLGIPCMMCGMTTSFSHYAHGEIISGFVNQPFSSVLFSMTVAGFVLSCIELISPMNRIDALWNKLTQIRLSVCLLFLFTMILSWVYKIYIFSN